MEEEPEGDVAPALHVESTVGVEGRLSDWPDVVLAFDPQIAVEGVNQLFDGVIVEPHEGQVHLHDVG